MVKNRTLILCLLVLVTACSPLTMIQPTREPLQSTPESKPVVTAVAKPMQAQPPAPVVAKATVVLPTSAPTPTVVEQSAAPSAPVVPERCQDAAQYITDDGLDGTTYAPNTPFTKTWALKNTGTCTWDSHYAVTYLSGTILTQQPGYFIVPQSQMVEPGQTVNISVGMTAPAENGNYRSDWGLKREDGSLIPIQGGVNRQAFYVKIQVNNGSANGTVTAASIAIEREEGSGTVCTASATYFVHASITTDGPATASYEISSTAGQITAGSFEDGNKQALSPTVTGRLIFSQADTKVINLRFVGPYPYPSDITVILRVNGGEFHNANLTCQG